MCDIHQIKKYNFSDVNKDTVKVAASLFWADGFFCVMFAVLTHFKYSRVRVLNYSVRTTATSNINWIWFFLFTALSSIMSGLNLWLNHEKTNKQFPILTSLIANVFSILSLLFAVKYQWQHREEAYNNIATTSMEETTPILLQQNGTEISLRPTNVDVLFVCLLFVSCGFFTAGWMKNRDVFYWVAYASLWLLQIVIFILILIIHCNITNEGPSVFIKCLLLTGIIFNTLSDIPAFIWFNCILENNKQAKGICYDVMVGLILISHLTFFLVMRTEFLRLKDVTKWHVADNIDALAEHSKMQRR